MAALLGKKLGMTQVFQEDGRVERVTVVEAGPVSRDRHPHVRPRRLRGRAARVRRDQGEAPHQGRARPPQEGRRPAAAPRRASSATRPASSRSARPSPSRSFEKGDTRQGRRHLEGQGLPGHDQAPQLLPRPGQPRLAQRARAGLDRRLRHAVARVQGHPRPGPDGQQARHPEGPRGRRRDRRPEPAAAARLGARAPRAAPSRSGRTSSDGCSKAPYLGKTGKDDLDAVVVRRGVPHVARPRDRARRAERPPPGTAVDARRAARSP